MNLSVLIGIISAFVVENANTESKHQVNDNEFVKSFSLKQESDKIIHLNTAAFGKDYKLRLKKSPKIFHDDFQLHSMEMGNDNKIKLTSSSKNIRETNIFHDEEHGSVIDISNVNGKLQAEGLLTPEISLRHSEDEHQVFKSESNYKKKSINKMFKLSNFSTTRVRREINEVVKPEVLVIVDYKHAQRQQFSNDKITKYLAIFWNAVNLRYATLSDPKIELSIVGAVIIKDQKLQPYIEKWRFVSGRKTYIDYMEALPALALHMYNNEEYPKHDLVMVMTGEDLASKEDDGSADDTYTGIAIVGGACTKDDENNMTLAVGIAEDIAPYYEGVLYHAHEVAHLLGAVHDGDERAEHLPGSPGAEACPFKDGYLMSYRLGSRNRVHWSQCTIDQIRWYLKTAQAECLHSRQNSKWPMKLNGVLPGTLVDIDHQCEYVGKNGRAWPQDKSAICVTLYCHSDRSGPTTKGPALEGTPCGYTGKRWCIDGECAIKD